MKLVVYYATALIAVLMQITFFGGDWSVNLVLAVLIVSSAYLRVSDIISIALMCGLLLDLHSGTFFGFNILFLLLAVLVAKFILHIGEHDQGFWNIIATLAIIEVFYQFIQLVMVFSIDHYAELGDFLWASCWQIGLTLIAGSLVYVGLSSLRSSLVQIGAKKHWLRGR